MLNTHQRPILVLSMALLEGGRIFRRKGLHHWGYVLKGDCGTPVHSISPVLFCSVAQFVLPCTPTPMCCLATGPKPRGC